MGVVIIKLLLKFVRFKEKKMKVFTYFQPIGESSELIKQKLLLEYWAKDWGSQGWQPIVLNEEDAATHSYYKDYKKEIKKIKVVRSFIFFDFMILRL